LIVGKNDLAGNAIAWQLKGVDRIRPNTDRIGERVVVRAHDDEVIRNDGSEDSDRELARSILKVGTGDQNPVARAGDVVSPKDGVAGISDLIGEWDEERGSMRESAAEQQCEYR
jgi:hypothetical protein